MFPFSEAAWPLPDWVLIAKKPAPAGYPEHPETVGQHIRKTRMDRGLFQRQVANALGAHTKSVHAWERNGVEPETRFWPKIICFLGCDPHGAPRDFGEKILAAMRRTGWSQRRLAAYLDVDPSTVSKWLKTNGPRWKRLRLEAEERLDRLLYQTLLE